MAALAQSVPQEAAVADLLGTLELPKGVRLRKVFFDTDWSGDPAIRIVFVNSLKYPLTKQRIDLLSDLMVRAARLVNAAWPDHFAYVTFDEAK
jgi:hypothetical protein